MAIHFEWTKSMSVGENHIDEQHKKLLSQLNKIIDAITIGVKSKETSEAIGFFDEYIKEHFSYEEYYMHEYSYPHVEEHIKKHDEFIKSYVAFLGKLNSGENANDLIMEVETYLGEWWINHIGKEDQKYHYFIDSISKK
ncbi:MAG: hemerythrin family protein [Candidatus Paceibacterota bacterium]|jgi:hemerythrin